MPEEKVPMIYKKISQVMGAIGAIGKDDTNDFQHYEFRGIDAVFNKLYPILVKHGIFVYPEVLNINRTPNAKGFCTVLTIKYTFVCSEDGSKLECTVVGEGADTSDKGCNKAMSAAIKYLFFQVFCIPTKGTVDADKDTPPIDHALDKKPKPKEITKDFKFLKVMTEQKKRLGEKVYYETLGGFGYEHANEITERPNQKMVFKKLGEL